MHASALNSFMPAVQQLRTLSFVHIGGKFTGDTVISLNFVLALPITNSKACKVSSPHGSGFDKFRTSHCCVNDIRLELHQEIICTSTAVYSQGWARNLTILYFRFYTSESFNYRFSLVILNTFFVHII